VSGVVEVEQEVFDASYLILCSDTGRFCMLYDAQTQVSHVTGEIGSCFDNGYTRANRRKMVVI
jgi:hypothetical protein